MCAVAGARGGVLARRGRRTRAAASRNGGGTQHSQGGSQEPMVEGHGPQASTPSSSPLAPASETLLTGNTSGPSGQPTEARLPSALVTTRSAASPSWCRSLTRLAPGKIWLLSGTR